MTADKLKSIAWTLGLVAVWSLLASLAVYQWGVFSMGATEWKGVIVAVIASLGAFLTNWLAPWVPRYGIGSK